MKEGGEVELYSCMCRLLVAGGAGGWREVDGSWPVIFHYLNLE